MNTYQNCSVRINNHGKYEMVCLDFRNPIVPLEEYESYPGSYYKSKKGLEYINFVFTYEEFVGFFGGKIGAVVDLSHNCKRIGELVMFYDMSFPNENQGLLSVPFANITIPYFVQKMLVKFAEKYHNKLSADYDHNTKEIELPLNVRNNLLSKYGQAKGKFVIECVLPEIEEKFNQVKDNENFNKALDNLKRIALNGTYSCYETGKVKLFHDFAGFYFKILDPYDRLTMNGGLINHGKDGKNDWSVHT